MDKIVRILLVLAVMILTFIVTDTILNYYYPNPAGTLVPNLSYFMLFGLITGYLVASLILLLIRKQNRGAQHPSQSS